MESATMSANAQWVERASHIFMNCYGERELCLVRGEGSLAWDVDGRQYVDFLAGIAANNLGHCHPAVVEAIRDQAGRLLHISNIHLNEPQIELAELICRETGMEKAFLCNSGTETSETGIKIARLWGLKHHNEQKTTVMVFSGAFHGRTYGALTATHNPKFREGMGPLLPGIRFAEFNNLADVDRVWDDTVAGVMIEPIQGNSGVAVATDDFLRGLVARCRERKALFIADEVQCGMGRTGRSFGYQHAGIDPDVVLIAKALGGGIPIAAVLARGEAAETFTKGCHGTTFGGNPFACAVALVASRLLFDKEFQRGVGQLGCHLWGRLERIREAHPSLCDHVRGKGLIQGLVLKSSALAIPSLALKHGLLCTTAGQNVIRVVPPLTITREQIDEGCDRLAAAVADLAAQQG